MWSFAKVSVCRNPEIMARHHDPAPFPLVAITPPPMNPIWYASSIRGEKSEEQTKQDQTRPVTTTPQLHSQKGVKQTTERTVAVPQAIIKLQSQLAYNNSFLLFFLLIALLRTLFLTALLLLLVRQEEVSIGTRQLSHARAEVIIERAVLAVGQIESGQPHIPISYRLVPAEKNVLP